MNPFNLLINYVIANSRASFYNVPGNQEITNTALLTGIVSENPLMSYLIIDNKAKIEGEKFNSTTSEVTTTTNGPGLPVHTETVVNPPTNQTKPTEGATVEGEEIVTLETIRAEIVKTNTALATITAEVGILKTKITTIEENKDLSKSLTEIKQTLSGISKENQTPDTVVASKTSAAQKSPSKPDTK